MRGIILAWLIGESIIVYRSVAKQHAPPVPGALLSTSGLFILLAVIAEYQPAEFLATALAFGVDIAALMSIWGLGTAAPSSAPAPAGGGGAGGARAV